MKFEEFKSNVERWAKDRGILQNGCPKTQALKLISEFGELCDAIAKEDRRETIDAIGDCAVVCVIIDKMVNPNGEVAITMWQSTVLYDCISDTLNKLASLITTESKNDVYGVLLGIKDIAVYENVDFMDCCEFAWNEIKDRKGFLNEHGVFVKESEK